MSLNITLARLRGLLDTPYAFWRLLWAQDAPLEPVVLDYVAHHTSAALAERFAHLHATWSDPETRDLSRWRDLLEPMQRADEAAWDEDDDDEDDVDALLHALTDLSQPSARAREPLEWLAAAWVGALDPTHTAALLCASALYYHGASHATLQPLCHNALGHDSAAPKALGAAFARFAPLCAGARTPDALPLRLNVPALARAVRLAMIHEPTTRDLAQRLTLAALVPPPPISPRRWRPAQPPSPMLAAVHLVARTHELLNPAINARLLKLAQSPREDVLDAIAPTLYNPLFHRLQPDVQRFLLNPSPEHALRAHSLPHRAMLLEVEAPPLDADLYPHAVRALDDVLTLCDERIAQSLVSRLIARYTSHPDAPAYLFSPHTPAALLRRLGAHEDAYTRSAVAALWAGRIDNPWPALEDLRVSLRDDSSPTVRLAFQEGFNAAWYDD